MEVPHSGAVCDLLWSDPVEEDIFHMDEAEQIRKEIRELEKETEGLLEQILDFGS